VAATLPTRNITPGTEAIPSEPRCFESLAPACFRNNKLLAGLSEETYAAIARRIEVIRLDPNDIIFEENEPGASLYLIAGGTVKISKKGRAEQQETLAYLATHDFFGEMALFDSAKRSAQAAVVDDVVLGQLDRQGWDALLRRAPHEVLGNFTKSVTGRLRHNNEHFIAEIMRNERLSLIGTTISSIVHDMNNPISSILCAVEVIRTNNQDPLIAEAAGLIHDSVGSMEVMTRELIDFSRGETQLNLQSISVRDFVHHLEPDFAQYGAHLNVRVEISADGQMKVDRHRLLRVCRNLIRNASEAMAQTDDKTLLFTAKRIDSRIRFEVSDTGCGISPDLLPRIFEPFVTHGKSNGTGLGLAISKAVVDAHHGSISVKSSDRGTTFQVDLPLER
jgi:signal transduction histidine kinase